MSRRDDRADPGRRDLPLIAWGEALRARKRRVRRLARRGALVGAGLALLLASAVWPPAPRLVWNVSPSAPLGLYRVYPGAPIARGDIVVAHLPARYRRLAADRAYLPIGVPLVKRVAAIAGDEVCAIGRVLFVEGRRIAVRRARDDAGRPMPSWKGCTVLRDGQLLLIMDDPASFDGRYIGPTKGRDVIGPARRLWRR